jgi:hypothetical protein
MNLGLVFLQFLPLILYLLVDYFKGFKAGIIAAIAAAVFMIGFQYATTGTVDQISVGESTLIVLLGIISLKMNNDRFFKFQPTVLAFIFASIFIYFEIKHEPLLVKYIPHMEKMFVGEEEPTGQTKVFLDNIHSPESQRMFARTSRILIFVFIGHGIIMAMAALYWSTPKWFAWRLAIYPAVVLASAVAMAMG